MIVPNVLSRFFQDQSQQRRSIEQGGAGIAHDDPVPAAFAEVVLGHIYNNIIFPKTAALLLVIVGAPGTGKSFNVQKTCERYKIFLNPTTGATFQGEEGAPRRKFQTAYKVALAGAGINLDQLRDRVTIDDFTPTRESALLIDDLHLSLASERSGNFSQNTQIFQSTLMSVCDEPASLFDIDPLIVGHRFRIPIIATTNATSDVYKPLLRHGRARVFEWKPAPEDTERAVRFLLSEFGDAAVDRLARKYRDEIPAFFREVASRVRENLIVHSIRNGTGLNAVEIIARCRLTTGDELISVAQQIKSEESLRSLRKDTFGH